MYGAVGLDIESQFLVVSALFNTIVADFVFDVFDRRMDRIDSNDTDGVARLFILVGGHSRALSRW